MKELFLLLFYEDEAPIGLASLGLIKNKINKETKQDLKFTFNNSSTYLLPPSANSLYFRLDHQSF